LEKDRLVEEERLMKEKPLTEEERLMEKDRLVEKDGPVEEELPTCVRGVAGNERDQDRCHQAQGEFPHDSLLRGGREFYAR
jgi:hypothetical protein